jgi:hypothetical protein
MIVASGDANYVNSITMYYSRILLGATQGLKCIAAVIVTHQ